MLEQSDLRRYATKQVYKLVELGKVDTFESATIMEKYMTSNLIIVPFDPVAFQICPYDGQVAYGIFTFMTCVKPMSYWSKTEYEFVEATVLIGGRNIEKVQVAACLWFEENRMLDWPQYVHPRSGIAFTPCKAKVHNREPYIPPMKEG